MIQFACYVDPGQTEGTTEDSSILLDEYSALIQQGKLCVWRLGSGSSRYHSSDRFAAELWIFSIDSTESMPVIETLSCMLPIRHDPLSDH